MKKPEPVPGLVIRYDYLWRDEAGRGRREGIKDRPCAIVVLRQDVNGEPLVLLAPITHSPPKRPEQAVEIPLRVKQHLGLDEDRSWIVTDELNSVAWNDAGIVPVNRARWHYGFLPPKLAKMVIERIRAHQSIRKLGIVDRVQIEKQSGRQPR